MITMNEIRVAVLGGSQCGKTSLISCMDKTIDRISVLDKYLSITRQGESFALLNQKYAELEACFAGSSDEFLEVPGQKDRQCREYSYSLEYRKRPLGFDIRVTDIPGCLLETVQGINECYSIVKQSHIVILAVDTPALMEEPSKLTGVGKYHLNKNQCRLIQDIVLDAWKDSKDRRLLIFAPIKCEKYEFNNTLSMVNQLIKKTYRELTDIAKANASCAIVPVQTMGSAVFQRFEEEDKKGVYRIEGTRSLMPQWADLVMRMILQYTFSTLLHYLDNPKIAKRVLGQKIVTYAGKNNINKFKRENGAVINNTVDKQEIEAYEVLSDLVELNIRRKLSDFNVLMFGPRRAGKSSVLSSMIHSFYNLDWQQMNNIQLQEGDEFTREYLAGKREELAYSVDKAQKQLLTVSRTEAATDTTNNYVFNLHYGTARKSLTIDFMDIPGERLMGSHGDWDVWLRSELQNCQIIIVAIDTPHMMEENGKYHDAFNRPQKICDLFKSAKMDRRISRLVLMVPIKCEKYYHEGRMNEVTDTIRHRYGNLLSFLTGFSKTTVAITPILTMGGIVFDSFEAPSDGLAALFEQGSLKGRPKKVNYKLYQKDPAFRPKFCEQPMIYLLSFILATTKSGSMKFSSILEFITNPWKSLKRLLNLWNELGNDVELQQTLDKVRTYLETEEPGFTFIQNPL